MKILALTGGIASGKSTVGNFFKECGAVLLDADKLAHQVYRVGSPVYREMVRRYGKKILRKDKKINRKALAEILFGSPREKKWVERRVHPATRELIAEKLKRVMRRRPPLILVEAALHVETGYYRRFPGLIVVHVTPQIQLKRLVEREGLSLEAAKRRIKNQMPLGKKRRAADWVIDNSGSPAQTRKQVRALFRQLTRRDC